MKDIKTTCKIALVQAEPVMFSKSASLKKALQYIGCTYRADRDSGFL